MADKFLSLLQGKIQKAKNLKTESITKDELVLILEELREEYKKYRTELIATITLYGWKGKSGMRIIKLPNSFLIIEYRKPNPSDEPKEVRTEIPNEYVIPVLQVVMRLEKNKKFKVREVSEKVCKLAGLYQFFDNNNKFDYNKLFGTRKIYLRRIYYPLHILEHYGLIKYYKSGRIERISDNLNDIQLQIKL